MEKIDIGAFSRKFIDGFDFLIKKYNFGISELSERSKKNERSIIHKIVYTNKEARRIIEFVLIAEDYETHMYSRIGDTYVKRILANYETPAYSDSANCFKIDDLNELTDAKFTNSETQNYPENYIERTRLIIYDLVKIFNQNYWPTISEIGDKQQKRVGFVSVGKCNVPYIGTIKNELMELMNFGYEIVFDETQIPPYEQSFIGPSIRYYNHERKVTIDITFQTRDQEFYVSKNKCENYFYGRATNDEYVKLKKKIISEYKYRI